MSHRTLSSLGEFGLIDLLKQNLARRRGVVIGIGDDAASVRVRSAKDLLVTTDMLIEGHHFDLKKATAYEVGRKAMAVNLSDIAAMAGRPLYAVVSIGLPGTLKKSTALQIYRGMESMAAKFGVSIVGGDTNACEKIIVSVALIGEPGPRGPVTRSGAKIGDALFVSGALGGSYGSKKHLRFTPRVKLASELVRFCDIHAMMDLSDGLASDLRRLTESSRVGAFIRAERVPVSRGADWAAAMTEGEDFELLFTVSARDAGRVEKKFKQVRRIGEITPARSGLRLERGGRNERWLEGGFDHFKKGIGA